MSKRTKRKRLAPSLPTSSIMTPELQKDFLTLIEEGHPADAVCDYLGVNSVTYYEWLKKGMTYLEALEEDRVAHHEVYAIFVMAFKKATAVYRMTALRKLHDTNGPAWIKHMTILERRDRKTFGRKDQAGGTDTEFDPDDKFL